MENNTKPRFELVPYDPKEIIKNFEPKYEFIEEIKGLLLLIDNEDWAHIKNEIEEQTIESYFLDIIYESINIEATKIVTEKETDETFTKQILKALNAMTQKNQDIYTRINEKTTFKELKIITVEECLYQAYNYTTIFNKGIENSLYRYINQNTNKFRHIPDEELEQWIKEVSNTSSFDLHLQNEIEEFINKYKKEKYTVLFENADFPTEFEAFNAEEAAEKAINQANELVKKINIKLYLPGGLNVYKTNEYEKNQNIKPVYVQDKEIAVG